LEKAKWDKTKKPQNREKVKQIVTKLKKEKPGGHSLKNGPDGFGNKSKRGVNSHAGKRIGSKQAAGLNRKKKGQGMWGVKSFFFAGEKLVGKAGDVKPHLRAMGAA